jgi:hypothetical protein
MTHPDDRFDVRARRVLARPARRLLKHRRTEAASVRIHARAQVAPVASEAPDICVLTSYRVHNEERLRMLTAAVSSLDGALGGSGIPISVRDSSSAAFVSRTRALWQATQLSVTVKQAEEPMSSALLHLLGATRERWFYLQFDDEITCGLSPAFLRASCRLLEHFGGDVGVVAPYWPVETLLDSHGDVVVVSHELDAGGSYRFGPAGRPVRPVATVDVDGHRFGIFENFTYGFFVNHLVADTADYRARLKWYLERARTDSVHRVENVAASGLRGPAWTHVAVCLDGVALVDLDFAHTGAAVRQDDSRPREVLAAVEQGRAVRALSREVPR